MTEFVHPLPIVSASDWFSGCDVSCECADVHNVQYWTVWKVAASIAWNYHLPLVKFLTV